TREALLRRDSAVRAFSRARAGFPGFSHALSRSGRRVSARDRRYHPRPRVGRAGAGFPDDSGLFRELARSGRKLDQRPVSTTSRVLADRTENSLSREKYGPRSPPPCRVHAAGAAPEPLRGGSGGARPGQVPGPESPTRVLLRGGVSG